MNGNSESTIEFDFLANVKALLGIKNEEQDALLNIYIETTKNSILNYCNISELPPQLNYTLCLMAIDLYNDYKSKNTTGEINGIITSVSEDGRTVSFSSGAELKTAVNEKVSKTSELNRYRKLYKV